MAPGHMLPMLDIAELFSARGVTSTILTTPANASLIGHRSGGVQLRLIPFPSATGLPEGCENLSTVPTRDLESHFFDALPSLRHLFDLVLIELHPDCLVSDAFLPWTSDVATELDIPRLVFHGTGFFARCALDSVDRLSTPQAGPSFVLPGLPHRITMLRSQTPDVTKLHPCFLHLIGQMKATEPRSYGVLVNSFYELEPDYARHYRDVIGRRAWCIGPVSLCDDRASIDDRTLLNWLETKKAGSVVYVSFGSLCMFSKDQLREIATGLESCGHPFVWVIGKGADDGSVEECERLIDGEGLIVRGWAPQRAMLGHAAVGAFLTHCGWNSSLEGVCAGLPMVTWPMFAEQFYNERLIVDVLRVGVAVGAKVYSVRQDERPVIGAAEIGRAVRGAMADGEEAEARRRRERELGEMAKRAMEKGGSSYEDIGSLIQELMERRQIVI